jgi:hypothetical protein
MPETRTSSYSFTYDRMLRDEVVRPPAVTEHPYVPDYVNQAVRDLNVPRGQAFGGESTQRGFMPPTSTDGMNVGHGTEPPTAPRDNRQEPQSAPPPDTGGNAEPQAQPRQAPPDTGRGVAPPPAAPEGGETIGENQPDRQNRSRQAAEQTQDQQGRPLRYRQAAAIPPPNSGPRTTERGSSTPWNGRLGAEANQAGRPHHIRGTLTAGGQTFQYGSGGAGRGSIPWGTYAITQPHRGRRGACRLAAGGQTGTGWSDAH